MDESVRLHFLINLRYALETAPILIHLDPNKLYILDTDASKVGTGAVLSQLEDGQEHVIAYFSRSLSKEEANYCVTTRELFMVVSAMDHFNPYLYGREFLSRTDHSAVQWLLQFKKPKDQIARLLENIIGYKFTIVRCPGLKHRNTDALPRRPCADVRCKYCEE
jgi:hypothetical protein